MANDIGNYARHAKYWDWSGRDGTEEYEFWYRYAAKFGSSVLIPMCALAEAGAYMAGRGMSVTAFDITPEMISEGGKRHGGTPGLDLYEGDVRNFRFDMRPADFCYCADFGHILTIEDLKRALVCINTHLRDGGALVVETGLRMPGAVSDYHPRAEFYPEKQAYPGLKVWKAGETRNDAETGRCHINQTFYAEDDRGNVESFEHAFYLQSYYREEWLEAFRECGFELAGEYVSRESVAFEYDSRGHAAGGHVGSGGKSWQSGGGGYRIFEAVKSESAKKRYGPAVSFDYLQTPIYRCEDVSLYNDKINLEQPNSGFSQFYRFDINAGGNWVGSIHVWIGYSIRIRYCGQIGYGIAEPYRNRGYMTKACLALKPFLRQCGFKYALITADENNAPSRRVCEKIGAVLLETVDTPKWTSMYGEGQRRTCVYEWEIGGEPRDCGDAFADIKHVRIDIEADKEYILERHCRINYECDTPWARRAPYKEYRAGWDAWPGQREGFLSALRDSMEDPRTIAEILKTGSGETAGYIWAPFHGDDPLFIWAEISDLYVEEKYRRNGLASYMLGYAEGRARQNGAKAVRSGTGCENVKSQRLHQKMGYYQYRMEYEKALRD